MLKSLFTTAWRSLLKNKVFSVLNIAGLSIGMTVFLLIALYVHFERSYEDFIPGKENIYRVSLTTYVNNELVVASAENYPGAGPAFKKELPEVVDFARLYNLGYKNNVIITYEDAKPQPIAFKHRRFLYADSSFLSFMSYPMVSGDPVTALAEPFTCVISESYAKMYFGSEDPIGKMLRMQDDDFNNELVKVTGVFKDLPSNTHLKFDILFSYKTLFSRFDDARARYDESWRRKDMYTFIKVRPGTDPQILQAKFDAIVSQYNPGLKERSQRDILTLQPLDAIHLSSNLAEEPEPNGDQKIVDFLAMIGVFVIIIAWINYINLSTARALDRAREVGVRKVMGALRVQLIRQFLSESAIVNLISVLLALILILVSLPSFNTLTGLQIAITDLAAAWFLLFLGGLWCVGTILSGFYPAVVLSSFKPVSVLKGKMKNSTGGIYLRKGLVVLQFMASVALIAGTVVVYRQLEFMMKQDIGMNIDQVLVVERPGIMPREREAFNSAVDVFRNELRKSSAITGISTTATVPGKQREYKAILKPYGAPDDRQVTFRFNSMDYEFLDVFKMKMLAGRMFSEDFPKDGDTSVIVTLSAAKMLGFKNPEDVIGQTLDITQFQWKPIVVGVVNDYHQVSLKKSLDPTIFYFTNYSGEFYSIRVNTSDLAGAVDHVRASWNKAFPGNPFDYFFLDDYFNRQYENERKFGALFSTFAALAVIVGCLGLFGLSAYAAVQRTKEIGIRKALGSSSTGIFFLLSKEYVKLIAVAIALAAPVVWLMMKKWIESFPYRTELSADIFILSGVVVLLVALLTVSFQTMKASATNPVNSLRYE
jgi:putative ABC transport system permease protein